MNVQKIFSKRVSIKLIAMGNNLISVEANKKMPKFYVFIFEKTEKLMKDLTTISQNA